MMQGGAGNIFKIPDLRKKILFTLLIVIVFRLGIHIPTPGINPQAVANMFTQQLQGTIFSVYDLFSGGALSKGSIFALGVMPYISASIMFQLLGSVFPRIQKLQQDEEGKRKVAQYTRYLTVLLAVLNAIGIATMLGNMNPVNIGGRLIPIIIQGGIILKVITIFTLTAGTIFLMWLGEMVTERGVGNGISFIIFLGAIDRIPLDISRTLTQIKENPQVSWFVGVVLLAIIIFTFAAMVSMTQAVRKIPVQYPKRVVGRRIYGGQSTFIPLRLITAGVIPIIFAQSIILIPGTIANIAGNKGFLGNFHSGMPLYDLIFGLLIVFFAYFYTSIVFNPQDLANNMKRMGGFIPGIRPGMKTAEYINTVLTRITLPGAVFLAIVALMPQWIMNGLNVKFFLGGTTYLIIVGVALDTIQQIESHLLMRSYEGLLKGSKLRGRR